MAQITTPEEHRPADAAHDPATKDPGKTLRLVHTTAPTATKHLASAHTAAEMVRWNETLVHFWLELAKQQVIGTAQTQRRLAGDACWRERLDIQRSFVSDSLTWLNAGTVCYTAVSNARVARSREARLSPGAATASLR